MKRALVGAVIIALFGLVSTSMVREANAGCIFGCTDVTQRCQMGCPATSPAERAQLLTTPNNPLQLTPVFQGAIGHQYVLGDEGSTFDRAWNEVVNIYRGLQGDETTKKILRTLPAVRDSILNPCPGFPKAGPPGGCTADRKCQMGCPPRDPVPGTISANITRVPFNSCNGQHPYDPKWGLPQHGCSEMCDGRRDGQVNREGLNGYFVLQIPHRLLDGGISAPPGRKFNDLQGEKAGHSIGINEGRLHADLRAVARYRKPNTKLADPLGCALHLASLYLADGPSSDKVLGQAFADLSVTGRHAFAQFRRELPGEAYCQSLQTKTVDVNCGKTPKSKPTGAALIAGCHKALDRAYRVANYLRTGQSAPEKIAERERNDLHWIAVSGEDDQPHRPVNVPASSFPQFDIAVNVEAPHAKPGYPKTVSVNSRYIIAQSKPAAVAHPAPGKWQLAPDLSPSIPGNADILLFIHGMDSRAEEAGEIAQELFKQEAKKGSKRNLVVISVDLPTSGFAENLDYERVSPLKDIGAPRGGGDIKFGDFAMTGKLPLLDFIENFVVRFVETLDQKVPNTKSRVRAVMGGSLGGNMTFRLGRRPNTPWMPKFIVWSPASIWHSMGEGADILKHTGPRGAWFSAADRDAKDPDDLSARRLRLRGDFFAGWDKPIVPVVIPVAQSDTWQSQYYRCRNSAIAGARLDRHETYDPKFLSWHWRLGAEQLLYSHQTIDNGTRMPRFMSNRKPMLLVCGTEDKVPFNEICPATVKTMPFMTMTPGKALILSNTGHSVDGERRNYFAKEVLDFLNYKPFPPGFVTRCEPPERSIPTTEGLRCTSASTGKLLCPVGFNVDKKREPQVKDGKLLCDYGQ